MNEFAYVDGRLHAEGVSVQALAEEYGTPLYIYSQSHMQTQFRALANALSSVSPLICYSVKANSNGSVIRTFLDEGAGLDIVSGGELFRALAAGADSSKIVFAGVGKTRDEIEYALRENIFFFTVESEPEAVRISECATRLGVTCRIAFRINPDVDPKTHKYVSTGKNENKFGLDLERAARAFEMARNLTGIEVVGIHMHVGSQILTLDPFVEALERVAELCSTLREKFPAFQYIDIGGGMGIQYSPDQQPMAPAQYAAALVPILDNLGLSVVLEPGRFLVGNAGILVGRVQYVKEHPLHRFVIADMAMNDLIRPALYEAYHEVLSVSQTDSQIPADLVGPVCESGDFIAQSRKLPNVKQNDLLAVMSAGAYGFAMASNYNSRPRAAEVMVSGENAVVVRERETWEDLVRGEQLDTA